jgi:hypothetical protein
MPSNIFALVSTVHSPMQLAALIVFFVFAYMIWITPRGGQGGRKPGD